MISCKKGRTKETMTLEMYPLARIVHDAVGRSQADEQEKSDLSFKAAISRRLEALEFVR